jgi:hypothetical protein
MTSNGHVGIPMPLETAQNDFQGISGQSASPNQGLRNFDMNNQNHRPNESTTQGTGNNLPYQNNNTGIGTRHFYVQPISEENKQLQLVSQVNFPPYNERDVQQWLQHMDFLFGSYNITLSSVKYRAITRLLPTEIICELPNNIHSDPNAFGIIKEIIINKNALSERQRVQMLLSVNKIGFENPKQFINKLKEVLGHNTYEHLNMTQPGMLKEILFHHLPPTVATDVRFCIRRSKDIAEFATFVEDAMEDDPYAGMKMDTFSNSLNPVYQPTYPPVTPVRQTEMGRLQETIQTLIREVQDLRTEINELKRNREPQSGSTRRSRSTSRGRYNQNGPYCYYHYHFGSFANRCEGNGCKFANSDYRNQPSNSGNVESGPLRGPQGK